MIQIPDACSKSVVLLHGLAANRFVMSPLEKRLNSADFAASNWCYPSTRRSIESHAEWFLDRLSDHAAGKSQVHVVTHSMGGIVARRAFAQQTPTFLGRIVMLAPPHAGSHVARRLAVALGRCCQPLAELSDAKFSFVNRLPEPDGLEVGIIAAAADRVVRLESTFLTCQRDHIVLPGHHGVLPWRQDTAEQVSHFLRHGYFRKAK